MCGYEALLACLAHNKAMDGGIQLGRIIRDHTKFATHFARFSKCQAGSDNGTLKIVREFPQLLSRFSFQFHLPPTTQ